jgi:hypothetical protein
LIDRSIDRSIENLVRSHLKPLLLPTRSRRRSIGDSLSLNIHPHLQEGDDAVVAGFGVADPSLAAPSPPPATGKPACPFPFLLLLLLLLRAGFGPSSASPGWSMMW